MPSNLSLGYPHCENIQDSFRAHCGAPASAKLANMTSWAARPICADCCGLINNDARIRWTNVCSAACNTDRQTDNNIRHNDGPNVAYGDGHV